MAIAYQSSDWSVNNGGNSVTVTKPTGVASGDLLIASYNVYNNENAVPTPPSGWTLLTSTSQGSGTGAVKHWIYWKIAGGSEPTNYTFDATLANYADCAIFRYTGHHPTNPISVYSVNGSSTTTRTGTAVTTPIDNSVLVMSTVGYGFNITSGPSGMTSRLNYDTVCYWYDQTIDSRGSTGNKTATQSGSDSSTTIMFVINPAFTRTSRYNGTSGSGVTSFASGSFTPTNNSLLVVIAGGQETAQTSTTTDYTITNTAGLTFTERYFKSNNSGAWRVWIKVWTAPVTTGTSMTVTVSSNGKTQDTINLSIVDYIGHNTVNPIGTTGEFTLGVASGTGTQTYSLAHAPISTSEVISVVVNDNWQGGGPGSVVTGTGWTALYADGGASETWFETQTRTGSTSTTVTWDSISTSTSESGAVSIAIEIRGADLVATSRIAVDDVTLITSYTTASFTPSPNSLLVFMFTVQDQNPATNPTFTVSGGSLSWTRQVRRANSTNWQYVPEIWTAAVGSNPASMTATLTLNSGGLQSNNPANIGLVVFDVVNCNINNPIRNTANWSSSGANPSTALGWTSNINNMVVGIQGFDATISGAPGSTWTGLGNAQINTDMSYAAEYKIGVIDTIAWTAGGGGPHFGVAVEIRSFLDATYSSPPFFRPRPIRVFTQRF